MSDSAEAAIQRGSKKREFGEISKNLKKHLCWSLFLIKLEAVDLKVVKKALGKSVDHDTENKTYQFEPEVWVIKKSILRKITNATGALNKNPKTKSSATVSSKSQLKKSICCREYHHHSECLPQAGNSWIAF